MIKHIFDCLIAKIMLLMQTENDDILLKQPHKAIKAHTLYN